MQCLCWVLWVTCQIWPLIHCMITARLAQLWGVNLLKQSRAMTQVVDFKLAEREGFEPSVQVLARTTV